MPLLDPKLRNYFERRRTAMRKERTSFIPHYKDLSQFNQPRRGRFETSDRNKGQKRHQSIINNRSMQALRTSTAGMFAGTMSPSRPWFRMETSDPDLMESHSVKVWLSKQEELIRNIFNQSNLYNMAPTMITELLLFGTGCMTHVDDFKDVARFYTHTAGSYMVGQDDRFVVNTLVREVQLQVSQIVERFGYENCSTSIQTAYDLGNYDIWFDVVQFIEPNPDFRQDSPLAIHKPYRSVYYEKGGETTEDGSNGAQGGAVDPSKYLSFSGFDEFPAYCPRWDVTGDDIYGTNCPGMIALGDVRSLQVEEKRKAQGIDKMVNPPLQGPPELRNVPVSTLPGGLTIYSGSANRQGLAPIYEVRPQLQDLREDIQQVERRIEEAFFVDLFLAISNMEGIQPRNQLDIIQRNEERLLQLGPVLERMHGEFLEGLVERTFNQGVRAGIIRNPPPELEGSELNIRFISNLAMAQRAVAAQPIERVAQFVGGLAQLYPEVTDKFDADQAVDEVALAVGIDPQVIVPDDIVAATRQARQEQLEQQRRMEQAQAASNVTKQLSDSKTDEPNMLTTLNEAVQEGA